MSPTGGDGDGLERAISRAPVTVQRVPVVACFSRREVADPVAALLVAPAVGRAAVTSNRVPIVTDLAGLGVDEHVSA